MSIYPKETCLSLYKNMVKIRLFEEAIADRYGEQEMRSPTHLYTGQEAVASGVSQALQKEDKVMGFYRGHGYYLAKGGSSKEMMAELYCKKTGSNQGKGGSMLLSSPKVGYVGSTAIVGGGIPIAVGMALASKLKQKNEVTVTFFGDAATEEGVFYESLNFAALRKLPVVFVCENNFYAVQSHISNRQAVTDNIYKRAELFDIPTIQVDGNDVEGVYKTSLEAVDRARKGIGPFFIEALTYRWHEHVGPGDDTAYNWRPKEELEYWKKKDPIARYQKILIERGYLNSPTKKQIYENIEKEVKEAFSFAKDSPLPSAEDLLSSVY